MELETPDRIWNRACLEDVTPASGPGDVHLHAVILAHGLVMNGGVLHCVEALSDAELEAARQGFSWLELPDVAELLTEAGAFIRSTEDWGDLDSSDDVETSMDQRYWRLVPDDDELVRRFRQRLAQSPADFAPA